MALERKHCVPCEGEVAPLDSNHEMLYLKDIIGWKLELTPVHTLSKTFHFPQFTDAVQALNKIAEIAEVEQHHPYFHLYYNKLTIDLTTHRVHGLTENDFIMASKIDTLFNTK